MPDVASFTVWYNIVRPIAVGAMLVGAAYTMFSHAPVADRFRARSVFAASDQRRRMKKHLDDSREQDLPLRGVILSAFSRCWFPLPSIYYGFTHGWSRPIAAALVMTCQRILSDRRWAAIWSDWWASSNQPLSGLTLARADYGRAADGGRSASPARRAWRRCSASPRWCRSPCRFPAR